MSKIKEALNEAEKEEKKKGKQMLPELHALDDKIEDFIQKLEGKINGVKDNPIFVRKAHQLLGDMSKEYSEFLAALRAIVNAVDRKGQVLPKENPIGKVRDINSRFRSSDENRPDQEGEEGGEEEVGPEGEIPPKKGIKEALIFEAFKKGDRVKVINPRDDYTGYEGVVYKVGTGKNRGVQSVRLIGKGNIKMGRQDIVSYNDDEIEKLPKTTKELIQKYW